MATSNRLVLRNIKINSFAGISKKDPIIISFPDGYRFLKAEGDQGTCKTSTIEALKSLLGANIAPNAINNEDNDKNALSRFVGRDGLLYQTKITKTTFTLENIVTDDNGEPILDKGKERTREEKKPKSLIKQLIGPIGIGPMELKNMDSASQVVWLQSHSTKDEAEIKAKQDEISAKAKTAYDIRTNVNRDIKKLDAVINTSDYFVNKEDWNQKFNAIGSKEQLNKDFEDKKEVADKYIRAEERLKTVQNEYDTIGIEVMAINSEIQRLQDALKEKALRSDTLMQSIEIGKKYLNDNKSVAEEQATITEKLKEIAELEIKKVSFDQVQEYVKERGQLVEDKATLTTAYKSASDELNTYLKSFVPNVEGLEIKVPTEEDTREGLYFRDKTIDQLCESELWEMCLMIWNSFEVSVVFVEHLGELGSNAIERLNWFVENGGYVFATEMDRAEKNIKITVNTKILE